MSTHDSQRQQIDYEVRRDIKTSNPRRLFRFIKNKTKDMGYSVTKDTIDIMKDEVGEVGVVEGNLYAKKQFSREISKGVPKNIEYISYLLGGIGITVFLFNLFSPSTGFLLLSILLIAPTLYVYYKKMQNRTVKWDEEIRFKIEGEIYEGEKIDRDAGRKESTETKITSETTVTITGHTPYPTASEERLRKNIEKLNSQIIEFVDM